MNINIKIPKLKFRKIKMDTVENLENIDYEKLMKENSKQKTYVNMSKNINLAFARFSLRQKYIKTKLFVSFLVFVIVIYRSKTALVSCQINSAIII